jgi:hypothetical protein
MFEQFNRPEVIRRERLIRRIIIGAAAALVVSGFLYYEFKNYREERVVKEFLQALQRQDYRAAYQTWKPAPSYRFEQDFLRDWGPQAYGRVESFKITDSRSRGSSVAVTATINGKKEVQVWVQKSDRSMAFPPF